MGDWKSSAIGGSDAKVMKSGVSKCTCLRSYRGGKRTGLINQIFIWSVLCDPMWSTGTRLFCTPRFYSSGSVNQKVEPEPFTESTPIVPFKLSMMVLLIVSPRPVPCLNSFILMKRSNMRLRSSSEIPIPVSCTLTRT